MTLTESSPSEAISIEAPSRPGIWTAIDRARDAITVRRVFGDPIEREGVTLVPAANVRGGGGGGGDTTGNGGGGFGLSASPAGAYIIRGDDVRWEPAVDVNRIVIGGLLVGALGLLVIRSVLKAFARR
jgi:uncharacterized spore protein YtfJ